MSLPSGAGGSDLDLDLVLVLPEEGASDDREALVDELTDLIERRTGNPAQVLAPTGRQVQTIVTADPLIDSLTRDARNVTGTPPDRLDQPRPMTAA